jgi:hypothetical protein
MATTNFTAGTVIPSTWLNDVNAIVYGSASPPANPIRVDLSGNVGVGVTPSVWGNSNALQIGSYGSIQYGTSTGYTSISSNLYYDGANWKYKASDFASQIALGGGNILFKVATSGVAGNNATFNNALSIDSSGNVLATGSGGIGYGTGVGGTVTQATSKSTAVTLNKICGQITMNAASLAANTTVVFSLLNSQIGANDVLLMSLTGAIANMSWYQIWNYVAPGSAQIALRNITGAPLAEAVVINFAVIKGSLS